MNIAFIPVRCGSKSIPFKNIKLFCNRPLVYWSLLALQYSKSVDSVYVATDCFEIESVVQGFNFSKVKIYNRESENATDSASTESVMLEFINNNEFSNQDLFLLVQVTSPLMQARDIDRSVDQFKVENCDSLLTCVRTKRFLWNSKNIPINYDYRQRPRRQDFKGVFMENGALYISTVGSIKRYKNRLSGSISIYEMNEYTAVELDENDDWSVAESLMYKYVLINAKKSKIKIFFTDVDGTLTNAGMYYGKSGEEFKKFNTHDGMGFEILKKHGIKVGIVTSEDTKIVQNRARKLKVDYLGQGLKNIGKLEFVIEVCKKEGVELSEVSYVGDDINCKRLLEGVGLAACPSNSLKHIKSIPGIVKLNKIGGDGAVREFIDFIIENELYAK